MSNCECDRLKKDLAHCFVENNINTVQGNSILKILATHNCFEKFPKDIRTLLNTPQAPITLIAIEPGEYVHIGLSKSLIELLSSVCDVPLQLILDISTDGAVADNCSTKSYWPIQIRVINLPNTLPIIIGLYLGKEKPSDSSKLFQCVTEEFEAIEKNGGINFRNKLITVKFNCFIGDAPARAYVLKHVGHTSYNACSKCKVLGQYSYRRMCFLGTNHCLRTNEEYNLRTDKKHHRPGESPLSVLKINPVSHVPFDYMHLVLLGVMKKLFHAWIEGKFSGFQKLNEQI
ncbi:uncharacterized protein LOC123266071 [Cotesia glomerata]|uniref:uncharacterized protein LOC123266071 n=1 Tax=Cotesia glomerata TaxID=32391 RepID=UPI001D02DED6|nr:uncharacterized protein LOC123266071 [Cotesia glomerata]